MWSKYKFYFIGVGILAVAAFWYYRKKKKTDEAEESAQTEALVSSVPSEESQRNLAKSLAYINQN